MHPLVPAKAAAFWRRIADEVAAGKRALLVAEDDAGIVGTVQLALDLPENQPHRADLAKMLVHPPRPPSGARRGTHGSGRTDGTWSAALLVLDTFTGSDAERLYARLGWNRVGEIPGYALSSPGEYGATTVFYKELGQSSE